MVCHKSELLTFNNKNITMEIWYYGVTVSAVGALY